MKPSQTRFAKIVPFLVALFAGLTADHAVAQWPPAPPLQTVVTERADGLPPSVTAEATGIGKWNCVFRHKPTGTPQKITLAGTFNNWNRDATPLTGPDKDGFWTAAMPLESGMHQYKFVINNEQWIADPQNPDGAPDNHGGQNSVLRLGRLASLKESPGKRGDGQIDAGGLEHKPELPLYFQPLAADRALLRYRTFSQDVEQVSVVFQNGPPVEMTVVETGPLFALYEVEIPLPQKMTDTAALPYTFVLKDGTLQGSDPQVYKLHFNPNAIFTTPDWAKNAVWYQVLVDRFRNGNPANDPPNTRPWTSDWFSSSPWETANGETFYKYFVYQRFYGGDLDGLEEKLPYLKELGINAIYLNPIFQAGSHHKYDTMDYVHVDDHYGASKVEPPTQGSIGVPPVRSADTTGEKKNTADTAVAHRNDYAAAIARENPKDPKTWTWTEADKRFLKFLDKAHAMGFRVVLDGVFNHMGRDSRLFQDVMKNKRNSPYADWFDVTSWEPFKYTGWAGVDTLPVFKKSKDGLASKEATAYIHAVTRRWLDPNGDGDPRDGIDGWRLDVPNEIPAPFWVEWRKLVKSINPNAYITGEIWTRADSWLDGQHFDAVMNYEFARAALAWVGNKEKKIKPSEIDRRLRELRLAYPQAATLVLQNLVDSHDTDRLTSMLHNPDRPYDEANRVQDNNPNYDNNKPSPEEYARARLIVLLQMTYVGAPMVWYGDEAGMWGADDPTCRKPMLWEDLQPYEKPEENSVMAEHLDFYKRAIALRNAHPALRTGSFRTLLIDDEADVWAFLRTDEQEQLIVVLNASNQARTVQVPLPDATREWKTVFGETTAQITPQKTVTLTVPPTSGVVLQAKLK